MVKLSLGAGHAILGSVAKKGYLWVAHSEQNWFWEFSVDFTLQSVR